MVKNLKIKAEFLTKEYELLKTQSEKIKSLFRKNNKIEEFWALRGVSFEIYDGESVGIVGLNGSGKSTLLNIVSGIIPPTSGNLEVYGDTSIISVGAGLKGNLTGRENLIMKCEMLGMTPTEIEEKEDLIIDFAGDKIRKFIDQPVKTYSSGMKSKLGFSILVHQNPDILIIDEALSVGDAPFFEKGVKRMKDFKEQGKTILFVSHSPNQVRQLCDKVIWLEDGEIKEIGETEDILSRYEDYQKKFNKLTEDEKFILKEEKILKDNFNLSILESENEGENKNLFKKTVAERGYSFLTKLIMLSIVGILVFSSVASLKGVRLRDAIKNPVESLFHGEILPAPPKISEPKKVNEEKGLS